MEYIKRLIEDELLEKMSAAGAVLIKGPKSCGKTATARQYAKSILEMDRDPQIPVMMATNPSLLLAGKQKDSLFSLVPPIRPMMLKCIAEPGVLMCCKWTR